MKQKEWLDEPNESGWWWCFGRQDADVNDSPDKLVIARVDFEFVEHEEKVIPFVYYRNDYVGFTGKYSGDLTGKWLGPIEEPDIPRE